PLVPPHGNAHRSPADTPIALCSPTGPPRKLVLAGLHLKWRDVVPFGYILDGAIRTLDFARKFARMMANASAGFREKRFGASRACRGVARFLIFLCPRNPTIQSGAGTHSRSKGAHDAGFY